MSIEQPTLRLGMIGFPVKLREQLEPWLTPSGAGWPHWKCVDPVIADAWWVHGGSLVAVEEGALLLHAHDDENSRLRLDMKAANRPIAFSTPLAVTDFEARHTFNPMLEGGARGVLQQFEAWLRPLRAQFALGAHMMQREAELRPGVYHLSCKGRLLAVIDLEQWRVGLSATARPVDFDEATWEKRPLAAGAMPPRFVQTTVAQLMWAYSQRTERDVLPSRYRTGPVYLRRPPRVPRAWLNESHELLLRELALAPGTFDTLAQRTGLATPELSRVMAGLYFAGAITSSMKKAQAQGYGGARPSGTGRPNIQLPVRTGEAVAAGFSAQQFTESGFQVA